MREWQVVTVALAPSSSCAIGLPKRFERPITTASAPSSCAPTLSSSSITPLGVHGRRPGRPSASSPAESVVSPSTSLPTSTRPVIFTPSRWSGSGSWTMIPLTAGSALSSSIAPITASSVASASIRTPNERIPISSH